MKDSRPADSALPRLRPAPIPLLALALLALALAGYLGRTLQSERVSPSLLTYADLKDSDAAPVVALLGEFRANFSYLLLMKTEQYLHSGVRYRPLSRREIDLGREKIHHDFEAPEAEEARHRESEAAPAPEERPDEHATYTHEHGHGHSHGAQLVPPPEWDRRGIFGNLDRAVHPYEKEGELEHGDTREMLPWYRLATYLNPRLTKAYVIGAFVIASYGQKVDQAEAFLREGLRMNPESIEIQEALGRFLLHRRETPAQAKPLFVQAIEAGRGQPELSQDETAAVCSAYSNLALLEWKSDGDVSAAREVCREGLERFPEYAALERIQRELALIKEE